MAIHDINDTIQMNFELINTDRFESIYHWKSLWHSQRRQILLIQDYNGSSKEVRNLYSHKMVSTAKPCNYQLWKVKEVEKQKKREIKG